MAAKKTDWKREHKLMQAWLENQPDNNFDPGTVLLERGTRRSVGNTEPGPDNTRSRAAILADLQARHMRRQDPGISKTMRQRLKGLFGGGEDDRHSPSKREAWDQLKGRD
jgi:hypothetical protein